MSGLRRQPAGHIGTRGRLDAIGAGGATVDIAIEEGELAILRHKVGGRFSRRASGRTGR